MKRVSEVNEFVIEIYYSITILELDLSACRKPLYDAFCKKFPVIQLADQKRVNIV